MSKRAWGTESAFANFTSVMIGMIDTAKKIYEGTLYNVFIGTAKSAEAAQNITIDLDAGVDANVDESALDLAKLEAMNIARNINYEMNHGNAMPEALASFETNFKKIMTVIKQLAPNAKIYIGNLYNPYVGAAPICCGDYVVVDLENFARTNIAKANTIISRNVNGNKVVDLYNTINNPKYIKGDVANCDYDPHPNAEGQKLIASKFIAAMSASN